MLTCCPFQTWLWFSVVPLNHELQIALNNILEFLRKKPIGNHPSWSSVDVSFNILENNLKTSDKHIDHHCDQPQERASLGKWQLRLLTMSSNNNLTLECEHHGEKWLGSLSPFKKPIKFMCSFTNKVGAARYIHKLLHHNPIRISP